MKKVIFADRTAEAQEARERFESRKGKAAEGLLPIFHLLDNRENSECIKDMYEYLESFAPQHCARCHKNWFGTRAAAPHWFGKSNSDGESCILSKLMMDVQQRGGQPWCAQCREDPDMTLNLDIGESHDCINALTDLEAQLIARIHPLMQVYTNGSGGWNYKGHVCNYRQESLEFVDTLPLHPSKAPIVVLRRKTRERYVTQSRRIPFQVNVARMKEAVTFLRQNHPGYRDVKVDFSFYDGLRKKTDDGTVDDTVDIDFAVQETEPPEHMMVKHEAFSMWLESDLPIARQVATWLFANHNKKLPWDFFRACMSDHRKQEANADNAKNRANVIRVAQALDSRDVQRFLRSVLQMPVVDDDHFEQDLVDEWVSVSEGNQDPSLWTTCGARGQTDSKGDEVERVEVVDDLMEAAYHAKYRKSFRQNHAKSFDQPGFNDRPRSQDQNFPLVDPPKQGEHPVCESTPGLFSLAFPKIFQTGQGDYNHYVKRPGNVKISLHDWARHVLLQRDGRAARCPRFKFYILNTIMRQQGSGARSAWYKRNYKDKPLDLDTLTKEQKRKTINQIMVMNANVPGTAAERKAMHSDIDCMVNQIEHETSMRGANTGMGEIPSHFITYTTAPRSWKQLNDKIRQLDKTLPPIPEDESKEQRADRFKREANSHPEVVAWYSSLKIELMKDLVTQILRHPEHPEHSFYDAWGAWEWTEAGDLHYHELKWHAGAPRIDIIIEDDVPEDGEDDDSDCSQSNRWVKNAYRREEAAKELAGWHSHFFTEWNCAKAADGSEHKRVSARQDAVHRKESAPEDPQSVDWPTLREMLAKVDEEEDAFDKRLEFLGQLSEFCQMHDWHMPFAAGPPGSDQSCAKLDAATAGTHAQVRVCKRRFPKDLVQDGKECLVEDGPYNFRLWLARNCSFMNNYSPLVLVALLSNCDIQACTSKHGVKEYITKYQTKGPKKNSGFRGPEEDFEECVKRAKEREKGFGSAAAQFWNKQVSHELLGGGNVFITFGNSRRSLPAANSPTSTSARLCKGCWTRTKSKGSGARSPSF